MSDAGDQPANAPEITLHLHCSCTLCKIQIEIQIYYEHKYKYRYKYKYKSDAGDQPPMHQTSLLAQPTLQLYGKIQRQKEGGDRGVCAATKLQLSQ